MYFTNVRRATDLLAFYRLSSVTAFTNHHRKLLYLTFVSSYIGYASEIGSMTNIESSTRATKFILFIWQKDTSYHDRLSRLNLLLLTY